MTIPRFCSYLIPYLRFLQHLLQRRSLARSPQQKPAPPNQADLYMLALAVVEQYSLDKI